VAGCQPVIPTYGRLRQENLKFEANPATDSYAVSKAKKKKYSCVIKINFD
jgi:hypothetical protein